MDYCYEGYCPETGKLLRLPRTRQAEAIAIALMKELAAEPLSSAEGKMYGVLLAENLQGESIIIKAFSGLLGGKSLVAGWVPPISGREKIALQERETILNLEAIKEELLICAQIPERAEYERLQEAFTEANRVLNNLHQERKTQRHRLRAKLQETLTDEALKIAMEKLDEESRQDGREKRNLKRERDLALKPLQEVIEKANKRIQELKQQRKKVSRELQTLMYASYSVTNFAGVSKNLAHLMPKGFLPTGTGECCAPKLLHYAAVCKLKPLGMAEFWWGPPTGDKLPGHFYGACAERCQPIMGFLLSGIANRPVLPLIYEDECLIVVDKPEKLLCVPGRGGNDDCVLTRIAVMFPDGISYKAVHRLDLDTSGIVVIARNLEIYRGLALQFQQREVKKLYEALLENTVMVSEGVIDLPLWGDRLHRPYQEVNFEKGKPSITKFKVIGKEDKFSRIEFEPITGRTHQLRVHAASGLGVAIRGDRLYGNGLNEGRLYLHAREISFQHPRSGEVLHLISPTPF